MVHVSVACWVLMVAGCEASRDEGGSERGETQRDQDRVTQLSQTQGESL